MAGSGVGEGASRGAHVATGRALLLTIVAIVLGVVLLQVGSRAPTGVRVARNAASPVGSSALPPRGTRTVHEKTTTTTTLPRGSVTVVVANGSSTNGVAAAYTTLLQRDGWHLLTPQTATVRVPTSAVYYAAGFEPEAQAIARSLSIAAASVTPISTSVPVTTTGADVVVVIGPDLAAKAPTSASSTTTSAPTTTTTARTRSSH